MAPKLTDNGQHFGPCRLITRALEETSKFTSLYLRGLIRLERGQESEGKTDILYATRLSPDIAARYEQYGLKRKG